MYIEVPYETNLEAKQTTITNGSVPAVCQSVTHATRTITIEMPETPCFPKYGSIPGFSMLVDAVSSGEQKKTYMCATNVDRQISESALRQIQLCSRADRKSWNITAMRCQHAHPFLKTTLPKTSRCPTILRVGTYAAGSPIR
jgi:hypothetical protein